MSEERAESSSIEQSPKAEVIAGETEKFSSQRNLLTYSLDDADKEVERILQSVKDTLQGFEALDFKPGERKSREILKRITRDELFRQVQDAQDHAAIKRRRTAIEREEGESLSAKDVIEKIAALRGALTAIDVWLDSAHQEQASLNREQDKSARLQGEVSKKRFERMTGGILKNFWKRRAEQRLREVDAAAEARSKAARATEGVLSRDVLDATILRDSVQSSLESLDRSLIESVFRNITECYERSKNQFLTPERKTEYNEYLIQHRLIPDIAAVEKERHITIASEDRKNMIAAVRDGLSTGFNLGWNANEEARQKAHENGKQFHDICKKYPEAFDLDEVADFFSIRREGVPDRHYDTAIRLIFEDVIAKKVGEATEHFKHLVRNPEVAHIIDSVSAGILDHQTSASYSVRYSWRTGNGRYNLETVPINEITDNSEAFVRWEAINQDSEVAATLKKYMPGVEQKLIKNLYNNALVPGGYESWPGTYAASIMRQINSPEAIPLLVKHMEVAGVGHTTAHVVHVVERLLENTDPQERAAVLKQMSPTDQRLVLAMQDKRSGINRFGFGMGGDAYLVCGLFARGARTITREEILKMLDATHKYDESTLHDYYLGDEHAENQEWVMEELMARRSETEHLIIESRLTTWGQTADKLLANLVNPRYGSSEAFPKRIVAEGLGIDDPKILTLIEQIMASKGFVKSGFERTRFTDGLLLLNAHQEQGAADLKTILAAYRGSKDDPQRVRRIFQMLGSLENFASYGLAVPSAEEIAAIETKLADLQAQLAGSLAKDERKKVVSSIRAVELELQNIKGLKGIEDALINRLAQEGCLKLNLPLEYQDRIKENLEELMANGIFEIIPTLAATYEHKNLPDVKELLSEITKHIIDGDFKRWRYTHERSQELLAGLSVEESARWQENLPPVKLEVSVTTSEMEQRNAQLAAVKEHFANAKAHILEVKPDFDFSDTKVATLEQKIEMLTQQIMSAKDDAARKSFGKEKADLQNQVILVRGMRFIDTVDPAHFDPQEIIARANEAKNKAEMLGIPMAVLDLEQVSKTFTVKEIKGVVAYESDDPLTLLRVGVEPSETCQSWRKGGYNECLLAYVADSNKKLINVADSEGRIIARSVIKLTHQKIREGEDAQQRTILVEPPYTLLFDSNVFRAYARILLEKARQIGSAITFGGGKGEVLLSGSRGSTALLENETLMGIFVQEARAAGFSAKHREVSIYIPRSKNKFEYSDTLGGKLTSFSYYVRRSAVVFENK